MVDVQKAKQTIGTVAVAIAFMFLFALVLQLIAVPIVLYAAPQAVHSPLFGWLASSLPLYCIAMPLSGLILCRVPSVPPVRKKVTVRVWIGTFAVCLLSTYLLSYAGAFLNELVSALLGTEPVNDLASSTMASPAWCNFIFLVILAPVFEEIFLRKLVIDRLLPYGELAAVLLSGIAFGLVHGNLNQLLYACTSGILFGIVYVKTGSITVNITLHAALNFLGGVCMTEIEKLRSGNDWNGLFSNPSAVADVLSAIYTVLLIAAALICIPVVFRLITRKVALHFERPSPTLTPNDWRSILLPNPFVWFFLAFSFLLFFI